jgi:hypothetical protein
MLKFQDHKLLKAPTPEEMAKMDPEALVRLHEIYHEAIYNAERDPYRYGFVLGHWKYADKQLEQFRTLILLGANRSAKTSYCARKIVQAALANPNGLIFCFAQNHEISVLVQQSAVYNALPLELREGRNTNDGSLSYTRKNGFSDKKFVLANGTQVLFKTYTQYQQDDTILEGMELGSPCPTIDNVGCWLDEYLLGMEMIDRLMLRLATHNSKLLVSFTPKDGETETVKNYRKGANTKERRYVTEGLKSPQYVPYLQHNERMNAGISYFHSKDNPWSGYESLLEQCIAKDDDNYTLTALYGVPTKSIASKFPRFSEEVNVIPDSQIPNKDVTRYMVADPAGSKPWFMVWIAVDASDTWYVYREFPDMLAGDWAEERNGKWTQGEACKQRLGWGVREYKDHILLVEDREEIFMRLMDPRMGANKYSTPTGGQSDYLLDMEDMDMLFVPAPGIDEEPGIQSIQDKLAYNPKKPIDAQNRPHLYIAESCTNVIKALQEYNGSSRDHPWKDPIDCLRYAAVHGIDYVSKTGLQATRPNKGGY